MFLSFLTASSNCCTIELRKTIPLKSQDGCEFINFFTFSTKHKLAIDLGQFLIFSLIVTLVNLMLRFYYTRTMKTHPSQIPYKYNSLINQWFYLKTFVRNVKHHSILQSSNLTSQLVFALSSAHIIHATEAQSFLQTEVISCPEVKSKNSHGWVLKLLFNRDC